MATRALRVSWTVALLAVFSLSVPAGAAAQGSPTASPEPATTGLAVNADIDANPVEVPDGELRESEIYGWTGPSPEAQVAADPTTLPPGRGAIFVPYVSDPADEPEFSAYRNGRRVGSGSTGRRMVVAPGQYRVEFGSGHERGISVDIDVVADETTIVPVTWGALRVEVVDTRGIPHRAGYELIRVADRDLFGVGYGADTLAGESVQTWILAPDLFGVKIGHRAATARRRVVDGHIQPPVDGVEQRVYRIRIAAIL